MGDNEGNDGNPSPPRRPPPNKPQIPASVKSFAELPANVTPIMYLQSKKVWSDAREKRERLSESHRGTLDDLDELTDYEIDRDLVTRMILTEANGRTELANQNIRVQYLHRHQRLKIPVGLAMSVNEDANAIHQGLPELRSRYKKIKGVPYDTLRSKVMEKVTRDALLTWIIGMPEATGDALQAPWDYKSDDDPAVVLFVYSEVSIACQMNFDVRDYGAMYLDTMSLPDNAWSLPEIYTAERLRCQLKSNTIIQIAGLNLSAVNDYALGAWLRAYGLAFGIFPRSGTAMTTEWMFVTGFAPMAKVKAMEEYEANCPYQLNQLCLSLIAMFGLFHLNKDRTYKSQDPNMNRIGKSWLNTVASAYGDTLFRELVDHQEEIVWTAPQPFGLAQTYWLAQTMYRRKQLPPPLMIKHDTTPPTVQRIMIARAAHRIWQGIPAGAAINAIYHQKIKDIERGYEAIIANPVHYSSLYHLYGIDAMRQPEEKWMTAANSLMPIVSGFAEALYVADDNTETGLALAMSLNNVKRDSGALASKWAAMWSNYMDRMDTTDIEKFANRH